MFFFFTLVVESFCQAHPPRKRPSLFHGGAHTLGGDSLPHSVGCPMDQFLTVSGFDVMVERGMI